MYNGLDNTFEDLNPTPVRYKPVTSIPRFLSYLQSALQSCVEGQLDATNQLQVVYIFYKTNWDEDAEKAADDCYEKFQDDVEKVFE